MKTVKDYRDQFASTREEVEAITDLARTEDRDFTKAEKTKLAALEKRMGEIEADLELQEKIESRIAQKIAGRRAPAGEQAAPSAGNPEDVSYRSGVAKSILETARTGQATTAKINPSAVFQKRGVMLSDTGSAGYSLHVATQNAFNLQATASTAFMREITMIATRNNTFFPYVDRTDRLTAQNKTQSAQLSDQDYTILRKAVAFRNYYTYVGIHTDVIRDSAIMNVDRVLMSLAEDDVARQVASDLLNADGASNNLTGIRNYSGVLTHDAESGPINYGVILRAYELLMQKNVADNISVIMSPAAWRQLATLSDSTGQFLQVPPQLSRVRWYATTLLPENLGAGEDETVVIMGDLSKVFVFVDEEIGVSAMDSVVSIHDAFSYDQIRIRTTWRGDFQTYEPDHLMLIQNINPSVDIL